MLRLLVAVAAVACLPAPAPAWSKAGHMVTGSVAYDVLAKDSPAALAKAVALLKAHPQYERTWKKDADKLPAADRDRYLFLMAGRWADDIRGDPAYDRPTWHYVNYPFVPAGRPDAVRPPGPADVNVVTAFADNLARVTAGGDEADRAVALTWVFHLVADVQQPLHTVSLFSADYPAGDKGGNKFYVRATAGGKPVNLHYFWDGLLTNTEDPRQVRNVAAELRLRPAFARDKLTELAEPSFENWAKVEGVELARRVVYRDGKLAGGTAEFSAPVLPDGYAKEAKAVGERRGVLAGYRIAQVLQKALDK